MDIVQETFHGPAMGCIGSCCSSICIKFQVDGKLQKSHPGGYQSSVFHVTFVLSIWGSFDDMWLMSD